MELNRPLRVALRPCQISAPSLEDLHERSSPPKKRALKKIYEGGLYDPDEAYRIWGYPEHGRLGREWSKLQVGDLLLFYAKKMFFGRSYIVKLKQDEEAANVQWPSGGEGYPCLLVYTKPKPFRLKIERFNDIVSFKPAFHPQGFQVLSERQSALVRTACNLGDVPERYLALRLERAMPNEMRAPLAGMGIS